jgi:hypothetical protein
LRYYEGIKCTQREKENKNEKYQNGLIGTKNCATFQEHYKEIKKEA